MGTTRTPTGTETCTSGRMAILVAIFGLLLLLAFLFGGVGALPIVLGMTVLVAGGFILSRAVRHR
jgi:hypothetical protein